MHGNFFDYEREFQQEKSSYKPATMRDIPRPEVPDGYYGCIVRALSIKPFPYARKDEPTEMLFWSLEIIKGPYSGKSLFRHSVSNTDIGREGIFQDFVTLCNPIESLRDIRRIIDGEEMIGMEIEVRVVTSKKVDKDGNPYRNVYINRRFTEGNGPMLRVGSDAKPYQSAPPAANHTAPDNSTDEDFPF